MKKEDIYYRIFTRYNSADTWRDDDNIFITELGYRKNIEDAKSVAYDYIRKNFFRKDLKLNEYKDGYFSVCDLCSYATTIEIQPIEIK